MAARQRRKGSYVSVKRFLRDLTRLMWSVVMRSAVLGHGLDMKLPVSTGVGVGGGASVDADVNAGGVANFASIMRERFQARRVRLGSFHTEGMLGNIFGRSDGEVL